MKTISTVALRNTNMLTFIQSSVHCGKRQSFEHIDQQIRLQKLALLINTQGLNENLLF